MRSMFHDREYLVNDQYRNGSNLDVRGQLHERFGTNPYGWFPWVFDRLQLPDDARVLELGCGTGLLWSKNLERIPDGWSITLSDLSPGMLEEARARLGESASRFRFHVIDAQLIPYQESSFDAVIALHMLFHVPDRALALSEMRRVLVPAGRLYASTLGENNFRELMEASERLGIDLFGEQLSFGLERGAAELAWIFNHVQVHRYEDTLEVSEAEPLIAYLRSGRARLTLESASGRLLVDWIEREIATRGAIHITKDFGVLEAW